MGVGHGFAEGKLKFIVNTPCPTDSSERRRTASEEMQCLRQAIDAAAKQLEQTETAVAREAGSAQAEIFAIHRMLLEDEDVLDTAESIILNGYTAAYAITEAGRRCGSVLSETNDEYLAARAADLADVTSRVARILNGDTAAEPLSAEGKYIIVAPDLSPSETVRLNRKNILGFVTFGGTVNSHTAILARALGIPALVGVGPIPTQLDGETAILDAEAGTLLVCPDPTAEARYQRDTAALAEARQSLLCLRGVPSVTSGGRRLRLYANIGSEDEVADALKNDAEGIGLLRSEFLYLARDSCPDEQTLFEAYRRVVLAMEGKTVIIRTLDAGADKQIPYLELDNEQNPAMGQRGVRLSLSRPELFKTQLRALCRASAYGKLAVMLPMISLPEEVSEAKNLLGQVQGQLTAEGVEFDPSMPLGIMVETPSAVVMASELAAVSDFFSVGTNDLLQYTLAADRQNPSVADLCLRGIDPIMKMIRHTVAAAHEAGIWVGICGELAADTALTQSFADMGVDELSVSPPYVLPLRQAVISCN